MDAKTILKNMTRQQALDFIGELIQCEISKIDRLGLHKDLEDAYFHIEQASKANYDWVNRDRSDDDGKVEYLDLKRREAND